jgi:hypothetical protein
MSLAASRKYVVEIGASLVRGSEKGVVQVRPVGLERQMKADHLLKFTRKHHSS